MQCRCNIQVSLPNPFLRLQRRKKAPSPFREVGQLSKTGKLEFLVDANLELAARWVAGERIVAVVQFGKAWIAIGNVQYRQVDRSIFHWLKLQAEIRRCEIFYLGTLR